MRALILLLASAIAVTIAGPAAAQSATKINQFNAWGTYSYQGDSGKVWTCELKITAFSDSTILASCARE